MYVSLIGKVRDTRVCYHFITSYGNTHIYFNSIRVFVYSDMK